MQKEINRNMTAREAYIYATERAGVNMQYYLDLRDEFFFDQSIMYIRAAYSLLNQMDEDRS